MVMDLPPDYYEVTALDVSTAVVVVEDDCVRTRDDFPLRNPASNELGFLGKKVGLLGGFEEMYYYRQDLVLRCRKITS
jgi:hypothetical protein